jgi:hypothetical protein
MRFRHAMISALLITAGLSLAPAVEAAEGGIRYRRSMVEKIGAPGRLVQKVACPAGTSVINGGVRSLGDIGTTAVVTSAPFDSGDLGRKPDDGWVAVARNAGPNKATMQTFAVCAESGKVTYVKETFTAFAGQRTERGVLCPVLTPPDEHVPVVGGGARIKGKGQAIEMASNAPLEHTDIDTDRDDGWFAGANNGSDVDIEMIVYAICAHTGTYQYSSGSGSISANSGGGGGGGCPLAPPMIPIGGGVVIGGSSLDAHLVTTQPEDFDDDGRPDDLWSFTIYNGTSSTLSFVSARICKTI